MADFLDIGSGHWVNVDRIREVQVSSQDQCQVYLIDKADAQSFPVKGEAAARVLNYMTYHQGHVTAGR
jgi:hypothetical protein